MRNWLGKLLYGIGDVWRTIGIPQRVSIVLIMLGTVAALGTVLYLGSKPDYVVLYSNMSSENAQQVIELVESEGVEFKARDDGRTILVPRQYVSKLKARARAAGVVVDDSPKGWRLFNTNELGMSQEQLRIKKQRAKQGELERMIGAMPGVKKAKVELAVPPPRAFYRKGHGQHATASVLLIMYPSRLATPQQVTTIRHQVAGAVDGLMPEDVTVSDNHGRLLARRSSNGIAGDPDSHMEIKEQIEMHLQEKAEAILRPLVGADNVVAMVTADVDFDKVEKVVESFKEADRTAVKERITTEEDQKEGIKGGTTGENVVEVGTAKRVTDSKGEKSIKTTKTTENEYIVPKTVERTNKMGARIKSISVAVSIARKGDTPIPQETLDQYKKLVSSAVGAVTSAERTDIIEVAESPFVPPITDVQTSTPIMDQIADNVDRLSSSPLVRVIFLVAVLGILYRIFKKQFVSTEITQAEIQSGIYGEDLFMTSSQVPELEAGQPPEPTTPYELVQQQSQQSPETIAQAMETMMRRENS